jgi:hypothetical protein
MPELQTPGDVKSVKFVDLTATDQVAGIWTVTLRSASDTIVVPGLESTSGVGSMKAAHTVTAGALTEGQNTVTIAGGSLGEICVFSTLHRPGFISNLSRDEDPT